ncbi:MAG: ribose 5-phosphate isomerase A [Gammaproteobacteria bacterium]|nr:ribose 5-phosphate isomerase A [Gammaproteobacteria bacterium]|tara:strand:- start:19438 stop:20103 length:666 start_codon:yes stop_codon:yes gene_type:complete
MNQDDKKRKVAEAALEHIESGQVIGIGTGSTVNELIKLLDKVSSKIDGVVSSSEESTKLLSEKKLKILELKDVGQLPIYIDGADESNEHGQLIKGGGGALTKEKILANASEKFICIIDESKLVKKLGIFPLPIETIKMAQSYVALQLIKIGGRPIYRENFITENNNIILDIHNLNINEPIQLEKSINNIPGVVTNGLFAIRSADKVLVSNDTGIETLDINV